jgi:hypothetical protein
MNSSKRLDVVLKTVFRISRRFFTNDFNRVTKYLKIKIGKTRSFYLGEIAKYIKTQIFKNLSETEES